MQVAYSVSQAEGDCIMNEHDIQYHLTHRQREYQIDGAYQRKAQYLAHTNIHNIRRRRKLKRMVAMIISLVIVVLVA